MIMSILRAIHILALVGAFGVPSISVAATYYLCYNGSTCNSGNGTGWSTGNSGNDGTSKSAAWQCPKDMQGKLGAGDMVIMGDGNYTFGNCAAGPNRMLDTKGMNGTAQNPIVIKAENKGGVVWDGEETDPDEDNRGVYIVYLRGCSFIEFHDFEAKRSRVTFHGNDRDNICHDITLSGMEIHDHGLAGILTQLNYYNINIDSSFFYDSVDNSRRDANHTCVHNHNLYLNGYNITLTNNVLHSANGGSMLTIGGMCSFVGDSDPVGFTHQVHAINNTFDGNGCVVTYTEPGGDKRFNAIDFWNRSYTPAFCAELGGTPRNFKNVRFENNLMLNGQEASWGGYQSQFISNTNAESVKTPPHCNHFGWWSASCEEGTNGTTGYLEVNNNVSETRALNSEHQAWADEYNNNCDECDGINLVNESAHDYRPTANSTALIGKGLAENAPSYDILGNPRNPGSIDIGAYQFSIPGPRPNPPNFVEDSAPQ